MNKNQWELLKEYIDSRIKELIADDHGRDSLHEAITASQCEKDFVATLCETR